MNSEELICSKDDLTAITQRGRKSSIADQLEKMGIPYSLNAAGWPVVFKRDLTNRGEKSQRNEPDLSWLKSA